MTLISILIQQFSPVFDTVVCFYVGYNIYCSVIAIHSVCAYFVWD